MNESGDEKMGVAKPIKPMSIQFENEQQEREFDAWAYSKEKSMSESAKRVRAELKAYREAKKRMGR
ncbi:hypothetical protein SRCM100730_03956 [Bacillus velezensis]|uniref:hypothetical protein n=1 Tax=Bacillus amyloliquefaciens group TaxID=1938374 RepID=UPI0007F9032F|nr:MULTISPECIES: hypothetical protein [Bacillus amyloliquefaciens group]MBI0440896.1 hypothetical protein [Bacillus velezensis]MBM7029470.1 hypothetical protein [Bacillus velezensis]MEC0448209.1 hypothetical protein [Bacillus velezensis]MED3000660.1 hypothetical protein [Bacillus velezensis]NIG99929.1 hypothetical protein [Bacillus amyloliquefaciens]